MKGNLLLVSTNRKSREVLPAALKRRIPDVGLHVVSRANEALERLSGGAYDAVVCCADAAVDLALVIRIKKRAPEVPVVVLSRVPEPGFDTLAKSMGAEALVRKSNGLEETAASLAVTVELVGNARVSQREAARSKELAREVRKLAHEARKLVALGLKAAEEGTFITLLVEDDSLQSAYLVRLLQRAKLPPFVRTVSMADEAIAYLEGTGPYADRERFPFPGLIVSDLKLPCRSGLELLRWVRRNPATRHLGFVMLTSSESETDIAAVYEAGADLYLSKSERLEDVVDLVRNVYLRYMTERTGSKPV